MVTQDRRVLKQSASLGVATIIANACLFFVNMAVVNNFGNALHGQLALFLSLSSIAIFCCTLGLADRKPIQQIVSLKTSYHDLTNYISTLTIGVFLLMTATTLIFFLLFEYIKQYTQYYSYSLYFIPLWFLYGGISRYGGMLCVAFDKHVGFFWILALPHLLILMATIAAVTFTISFNHFISLLSCMYAIGIFTGYIMLKRLLRDNVGSFKISRLKIFSALREIRASILIFIPTLVAVGLPALVILLVGWQDPPMISITQVTLSIALVSSIISYALSNALFKSLSENKYLDKAKQSEKMTARIYIGLGIILLLIYGFTWLFGKQVLEIFYGETYANFYILLILFTLTFVSEAYSNQIDQALFVKNKVALVISFELSKLLIFILIYILSADISHLAIGMSILTSSIVILILKVIATHILYEGQGTNAILQIGSYFLLASIAANISPANSGAIVVALLATIYHRKLFFIKILNKSKRAV
jgi:O-antigen/teichoic acid export membrane protein